MCGIAGLWSPESGSAERLLEVVRSMTDALVHRGPDDSGTWADADCGIALGHRRLSILDLSPEGRQPMESKSGRYVMTFNGEVYNYRDIRRQIEASRAATLELRGHSDTEVMLAAIDEWGSSERSNGSSACSPSRSGTSERRRLSLVRDRLGIKPLYYGVAGRTLVFGSELKALTAHEGFSREIDRQATTSYLRFGYVPAPSSIYASARKLPPGSILEFSRPRWDAGKTLCYWSPLRVAQQGLARPFSGTERDAVDELERLLAAAVKLRLVSDVPIGAFLSGGIDSSTVVSLMQRASQSPVRTFSIANEGAAFDESESAAAVARHLGTRHTSLTVTAGEAQSVIPQLPHMYDEPFADTSQIPTFLVSRLARRDVTVSLSGDGGDELFGGYNRHVWGPAIWNGLQRVPRPARAALAHLLVRASPQAWDRLFELGHAFLPALRTPGTKVHKLARILDAPSADELYRRLTSLWEAPERLVRGGQ